ncbi:MAG TPA: flagellar filament capping protein FliD [Paucimonas sp.]|nr:flagellar filament capping protein FliD [Paucimonas sp.]
MASISSPGIGSNLDVNGLITKLMAVESQPLAALQKKEASYQAKLSAYGSIKGALSAFQSAVSSLSLPSTFQTLNASSSDSSILTASASSSAVAGNYAVTVSTLAQAQSLSATAQSTTTAAIGSGTSTTLTFQFGTISGGALANGVYTGATFTQDATQATGTVVIDSSNNSLQGIRDAINAANMGVTASIVNDGSSSTPYRLVLTSSNTGLSKSMKIISSGGDASITNLLAYDPAGTQNLTQTQVAQNAALTVNGVSISSASNTVTGAVSGVTLNLAKAGSANLSLTNNTSAVTTAVIGLVKAYNDANSTLAGLTSYNATTKKAGILLGDSATQQIQSRMRSTLSTALSGLGSNTITNLSQIGISFQKDGSLTLDNAKLQSALSANFGDFAQLFSAYGKTTDSLVSYLASGTNSQPGSYPISVTNLATQGKVTGSAVANTTVDSGDQLTMSINGVTATVSLTAGSYTADTLAAHLQSAINGTSAFSLAGIKVNVTQSGGVLTVTSDTYGSASTINVTSGSAINKLFGAAPTATPGTDVAGTINGVVTQGKTVGSDKGTQAQRTAGAAVSTLTIDGTNDTLTLSIDGGASVNVSIAQASYGTAADLATAVQAGLDAALGAGVATVTQSGGTFSIKSNTFGSTSSVGAISGNGSTNLFGAPQTSTTVSTITAGVNDQLTLSVDGTATTVTLAAGTYTADALATQIQTAINADATLTAAGKSVTVSQSGDVFTITSNNKTGSNSTVAVTGGSAKANLLGADPVATAGAFTGVRAIGSGQTLTAGTGLQGLTFGSNKGTQAQRTGSSAAGLTIDGTNDTLTFSINGAAPVTATIAQATYATAADLATAVQAAIDAQLGAGVATITQSSGVFSLKSNTFGSSSSVSAVTGNGATNLFGTTQSNSTVSTITAGVNDELTLNIDGTTATVTLTAGTYTAASLASHLQSAINSNGVFSAAGKAVTVSQSGEVFTITSNATGTASSVTVTGGTASANLFGSAPIAIAGNATANAAGDLRLQVTGGSLGSRGNVNYSQGYGYNLNKLLDGFLSSSGAIASSTDSANKSIADLKKRADALALRLTATEKRYRAQFTALDQLIGKMSTTSSFLTQQLANLSKLSSSSS